MFAANEPKRVVTLDDIYALLTTADGQNRLEEMADLLHDMNEKADIVGTRAERKTAEEKAQAEEQAWTLEDMKYFLDSMNTRLTEIGDRLDALEECVCP
ncbi:MAG: hypothetical protein IMY74_09115 [Bacteroidetes bacterium]|nr:hypothetical protein [Bacteroidota bacterium]